MKIKYSSYSTLLKQFILFLITIYILNFQLLGQDILSKETLNTLQESSGSEYLEKIELLYDSINRIHDISDRTVAADLLFEVTKERGGLAHTQSLLFRKLNTLHSEESGLFSKAYKQAKKSGDFDAMCLVEYSRANYFIDRKQYDSAMIYLLYYRDMTPKDMQGEGYRNIVNQMGDIYYHAGLYEQAREVYESLYNQYVIEDSWNFYRPYVMMNNLGQIALKIGDIESADLWFRLSLQRAEEHLKTPYRINTIAYINIRLAETAIQQGDLVQASAFLQRISTCPANQIRDDVWLDYLWQQAHLLFKQHNYDDALKKMDEMTTLGEKTGLALRFIPEIYNLLSDLYRVKGNLEKALYYSDLYIRKTDSIRSNEYLAQSMVILSDHNHTATKIELQETKTQYSYLLWGSLILVLFFLILLRVSYNLHRSKLALVRKSVAWSHEEKATRISKQATAITANTNIESSKERDKELLEQLKYFMETEKPYINPKLSIVSLANQLSTNRTYLSQAVNSHYTMTFPNFINEYRINEAVKLITSGYTEGYTQEALAKHVGFSSRSTFIAAFKRVTGVVPSFFIANLDKVDEITMP